MFSKNCVNWKKNDACASCLLSTLQRRKSSAHDFVDKEEIAGDDGARVDHLTLDIVVVVNTEVGWVDDFAGRTVEADGGSVVGLTQQLYDHLLGVIPLAENNYN